MSQHSGDKPLLQSVIRLDIEVENMEFMEPVPGKYAEASFVGELEDRTHEISNIAFRMMIWTWNLGK